MLFENIAEFDNVMKGNKYIMALFIIEAFIHKTCYIQIEEWFCSAIKLRAMEVKVFCIKMHYTLLLTDKIIFFYLWQQKTCFYHEMLKFYITHFVDKIITNILIQQILCKKFNKAFTTDRVVKPSFILSSSAKLTYHCGHYYSWAESLYIVRW